MIPDPEGSRFRMELRGRIMVATPCYTGAVISACAQSLQTATILCMANHVIVDWSVVAGMAMIQYARNWLLADFLIRRECTHLLWLDDDLAFEPDAVMKLFDRNLDVVGGVYPTKSEHPTFPYKALGPVVNGLQEVGVLPSGFVLVSRRAVLAVAERCQWYNYPYGDETRRIPHAFDVVLEGDHLVGEDFFFCKRLRDAGFKLYVETDLGFRHYGRQSWTGNLATTLSSESRSMQQGQGLPEAWRLNAERIAKGETP